MICRGNVLRGTSDRISRGTNTGIKQWSLGEYHSRTLALFPYDPDIFNELEFVVGDTVPEPRRQNK